MLDEIRTNYKQYEVNTTYTRAKVNIFKVCLIKPETLQNQELEKIEADIKRAYKDSLAKVKEQVTEEILLEVEQEKAATD